MAPDPPTITEIQNPKNTIALGGAAARNRVAVFFRRWPAGWWFTLIAALIWLAVHGDHGITWDEPVQSSYGEEVRKLIFHEQNFADFSRANLPKNIYYYDPALDLFCATVAHGFDADIFAVRHGVQGWLWVAMFYPVCALGRRISGRLGAWFAGLALLGMPSLFGQAFNNPKDLPLACAVIWLLHVSVSAAAARRPGWRQALQLGGAFGFMLAMRPGAWFLGGLLALVPLAQIWRGHGKTGRWAVGIFLETLPVLGLALLIGWGLMILPWPNAWHSPLRFPVQAAGLALHFKEVYPVLLGGILFPSNRLPGNYLAIYLVLTLPVPFLILGAWGHLVFWRKRCRIISAMAVLGAGFLIWFPLVAFILARPNVYDGMRHFLFLLPPVAVLVGVAATDLVLRLPKIPAGWKTAVMAEMLLSAVPATVRLHPYQNVYYNFLAGPRATLHERYETDYWVSSYRSAASWINTVQSRQSRPLCVLVAASEFSFPAFTHFLNPKTTAVCAGTKNYSDASLAPGVDYYVATVRYGQWQNFPAAPVAQRIERDGVLLTVIRERSPH